MKKLDEKQINELIDTAIGMMDYSYVPYSHFHVGAALLAKNGTIYGGCNIENAAFTPTNCAERTAFFQAVSQGEREFSAIAIVGGRAGETCAQICPPCGICRQVMREFCTDDFLIYLGRQTSEGEISYQTMTLGQLLPESFGPDNL